MKNERLIKIVIVGILLVVIFWFGLMPIFDGTSFDKYLKSSRADLYYEENEYSTIVIGSDPEGVASALTCAGTGLKTLLITRDDDLGGYLKKNMIAEMKPEYGLIEKQKVILNLGIYEKIFGNLSLGFSGEDYKKAVEKLTDKEESLDIIFDSYVMEVEIEDGYLNRILVQEPDGKHYYKGRNYIDASQDGELLLLAKTPYSIGSADIGIQNAFAPLEFNFKVSGVDIEALKSGKNETNFINAFQLAIMTYKQINSQTKIISPSFIILNDDELVINGMEIFGVDCGNQEELREAYWLAEEEAIMLTAYLKTIMVPFKNCTYQEGSEEFFIPAYRHFEGRYKLTVADILENRDFEDKIVLASGSVDAGAFINKSVDYIVTNPNVYSIPLRCVVPINLQNVLMTGSKASFTSLSASSAGSIPTRITLGESVGFVSAFSYINDISPSEIINSEKNMTALMRYLSRGGIKLVDFDENIFVPDSSQKLADYWAYSYVKTLAEYGLIAGGMGNDFKLDYEASQELLTVLIRNAILKMAPDYYNLDLDSKIKEFELKEELTGEIAAAIILETLNIEYEIDEALETLILQEIIPVNITERLEHSDIVTMDEVYGLVIETVKNLNR